MRAPVAIINFTFFARGLLIESYINSEIFAGIWRKINYCNRRVSPPHKNPPLETPEGFPLFSGKVRIVSRTLSGLFLVGAVNRPRKRKRTNQENPRRVPGQIGKIPENRESPKRKKRTKKEGQVQIGKPPRLKPPRLAALDKSKFWRNLDTRASA